ncbi:DUF7426 family protein [Nocardia bovistercoris]|uniref:DUF7426 domain-containing protein n=1 Tax=Nocardia bovistercoris TaxID=2785916 RepID=A0A931N5M7_9NOCA|nr:hypothetical protein [Nocardia bovistercoris]MBH0778823.1 hypothetical protein [Nocardia bovistercoris]
MDDYESWADPDLCLPVRGHVIRVKSPTAAEGLRLRRLMLDVDAVTDADEQREVRRILGDAWHAFDALRVDETARQLVGRTALLHFGQSPDAAAAYWNGDRHSTDAAPTDPSAPGFLGPDDPGGGPVIAGGMRAWFNPPAMAPRHAPGASDDAPRMSWRDVFACWPDIELDLHTEFGVDVDSGVLDQRPWRWLEVRIRALATTPRTRLYRSIFPPTS